MQHSLIDPTESHTAECSYCDNVFKTEHLIYIEETDESICKSCAETVKVKTCPDCLNELIYFDQEMCETCEQSKTEEQAEKDKEELLKESYHSAIGCLIVIVIALIIGLIL